MKILITEPQDFSVRSKAKLDALGTVVLGSFSRAELKLQIKDADVLIIRLGHYIDKELLSVTTKLKYILSPTTGLNHIDTLMAQDKGITIISLKGETKFLTNIPSTAEYTWALLMSLIRQIPRANDAVRQGKWKRDDFKSHNLNALKLGIIGYGRVGKQIAMIAKSFNMFVYVFDIKPIDEDANFEIMPSLKSVLSIADVVSIHADYNESTKNLINADVLKHSKNGQYLINTSRGELLNEVDICDALDKGILKGIAIDTVVNEIDKTALSKNILIKRAQTDDSIIITPHIAGATYESMWMTEDFVVDKFIEIKKF